MNTDGIAEALKRARDVFTRRPASALHEDSAATARWQGGLRVETAHASGKSVISDMPVAFGGSGEEITPGWFSRAGTAACTATCISMAAATRGVHLTVLEVRVSSRSDARGTLGMTGDEGSPVDAASSDFRIQVLIGAKSASKADLERLVTEGYRSSPSALALSRANEVTLEIVEAPE